MAALLALCAATAVGAALLCQKQTRAAQNQREYLASIPRQDRADGYVRSDTCRACHPNEFDSWSKTYHRTMTQIAGSDTVLGKFDTELWLNGQRFDLKRQGGDFWVEMEDPVWRAQRNATVAELLSSGSAPRVKLRVGLLTGSHHMQVCWVTPGAGNLQLLLPFAWLKEEQRWVPFHQTFLRDPKVPVPDQFWNKACINCHSTAPVPKFNTSREGVNTHMSELGIACGACHGPAENHVREQQNPAVRYAAHTRTKESAPDKFIVNPARLDSKRASEVCGQCHGIHWIPDARAWSEFGNAFRPGMELESCSALIRPTQAKDQVWAKALKENPEFVPDRYWPDGMVRVSGREFNGLVESPCYKKGNLSCLSCHSMHQSDPNDQLAARMDSNEACFQCHSDFRNKLAAHTRHSANSSGSLCYNCHMPFTTYGLLKGIRSHQIDSPNIAVSQKTGRPNACNGCHLDKSMEWSAKHLHEWFGQPVPKLAPEERELADAARLALKGDAGQRALTAHALGWIDAQKASGTSWVLPYLAELLDDPYSAVRYIAHRSLRTLPQFKDFQFDFTVERAAREPVAPKLIERWQSATQPDEAVPSGTLIQPGRTLDMARFRQLLSERDHKSTDLQE